MDNWQEIIALGIVASTAFVLGYRIIRQWLSPSETVGGCDGCRECKPTGSVPKAAPSLGNPPSTSYQLLKLEVNPALKNRATE